MIKRLFDIVLAGIGIVIFTPVYIIILVLIKLESSGGVLFMQERVGQNMIPFEIYKFRTMIINSESEGKLTIGADKRITKVGKVLRKYKLDELPQLINIIKGEMSFVGPRPEVPEYIEYYTEDQQSVFHLKPGVTDWASLKYYNENKILEGVANPEEYYITKILPDKLNLSLLYLHKKSFWIDIKILLKTFQKIFNTSRKPSQFPL